MSIEPIWYAARAGRVLDSATDRHAAARAAVRGGATRLPPGVGDVADTVADTAHARHVTRAALAAVRGDPLALHGGPRIGLALVERVARVAVARALAVA